MFNSEIIKEAEPDVIMQFEKLYEYFRSDLNFNRKLRDVFKTYVELKKVRKKLTEAENNFLSLHINPNPNLKHLG